MTKEAYSNLTKALKKNPGALHRKLGVPAGKKIPASKLAQALRSKNPTERKEAVLARTASHFKH